MPNERACTDEVRNIDTIYRMVLAGMIEEKILELHATKRDLAESLLEGTDRSRKLTSDELLQLIKP